MRRRASALLLLGGWLLMLPPWEMKDSDGHAVVKVDQEAPISRWEQESAYDTARECQAGKASLKAERDVASAMLVAVIAAARCVPSNVVYPSAQK